MVSGNVDESAILDAASEVFARKGFAGARVDEIAALAGVNKAMLYYRVGDKEELYRRVVLRGQQGFLSTLTSSVERCSTAVETMNSMVRGITGKALKDRLIPSIILRELAGHGATLPGEARERLKETMDIIRSTVAAGIEEGSFRKVNPTVLQFMVLGTVFTLALTTGMRSEINPEYPGPIEEEDIASAILEILSMGILKEDSLQ